MSTFTAFDKSVPLPLRVNLVADIAVGDQINMYEVLGRPANRVVVTTSSGTDVVEFRMNNLIRISKPREDMPDELLEIWSVDAPTFSAEGTDYVLGEGLPITSIEIIALTLSSGTTISMSVQ